jgi:hypothetical protein
LLTAFLHFNDELKEFGHRVITQLRQEKTKFTLTVPDRSVVGKLAVSEQNTGLACGYETATETRKAQEQAIKSAEKALS